MKFFLKQSGIYELQLKSIFFLKIIYEPFKWSICYFVIIIWMSAFLIIWNTCFPQGLLTGNSKMLFYNLLVMVSFIFIYIYFASCEGFCLILPYSELNFFFMEKTWGKKLVNTCNTTRMEWQQSCWQHIGLSFITNVIKNWKDNLKIKSWGRVLCMVKSTLSLLHTFSAHLHCYFPKSLQLLNYAN